MQLLRAALVAALFMVSTSGWAVAAGSDGLSFGTRDAGGRSLWFSALFGAQSKSAYFGSDETETTFTFRPTPIFLSFAGRTLGKPELKDDPRERDPGFGLRGSFRFIGERDADDYDDLDGLNDVDPTLEVGVGVQFTARHAEAFADLRYGLGGSDGWVGELGANLVARPSDRLALRVGPRLLYGSENYVDTYFGISDSESARSGLDAYDPGAGLVSAGIEFTATYRLGEQWWLEGGARYDRFQDDAADSPIVTEGRDENTSVHIGLRRAFVLDF